MLAALLLSAFAITLGRPPQDPRQPDETAEQRLQRGKAHFRNGELDEAHLACAAALAEFERNSPEHDLPAADALLMLGAIAGTRQDLPVAVASYRRALALRERHDAPGAPYLQLLRFNLAASLQALSSDAEAFDLARAALREVAPRHESAPLTGNLHAVAAMAGDGLGRYQEALRHYDRALAVLTARHGEGYADVQRLRGLRAVVLCRVGRADEGLPLLEQAAAALAANAAPAAMQTEAEIALAVMRSLHGSSDEAATDLRRQLAQAIADRHAGVPGAGERLILLGGFLDALGGEPGDQRLAEEALAGCEADHGSNHVRTAVALANVGMLHGKRGDFETSNRLLDRAVAILDAHPTYLGTARWTILWNRAAGHLRSGEREQAQRLVGRMLDELPRLLDAWTTPMAEHERRNLVSTLRKAVDVGVTVARQRDQPASTVWRPVLAWRHLLGRGFLQSLHWLQVRRDPEIQRLADELRAASALVEWLRRRESAPALAEAVARREAADRRMQERLSTRPEAVPTLEAITAALAADEVWVDFYAHDDLNAIDGNAVALEERLLALVVRPDRAPVLVDLGPLEHITAAVDPFLRASARWTRPTPTAPDAIAAVGARLAELVWRPLREHVPAQRRVLISPDSVVALVPWACLPDDDGGFLVERHEFVQIADPSDLLARGSWRAPDREQTLLCIGAVDYGPGEFAPLPSTQAEIAAVSDMFDAAGGGQRRLLTGTEATVDRFGAAVGGATFVHVATHGWFRGTRSLPSLAERWRGIEHPTGDLPGQAFAPGADSGIALASARAGGRDQGCLTADDLAELDLGRCELAVLSACETGLGTVSAGDGLLGLRRAIRLAGARRSLTTVWRVDDAATQRFMTEFYGALWQRRDLPGRALRSAQLARLAVCRRDHGQALTGRWGAFVLESR